MPISSVPGSTVPDENEISDSIVLSDDKFDALGTPLDNEPADSTAHIQLRVLVHYRHEEV